MKKRICRLCGQPFEQAHPLNHICKECEMTLDDMLESKRLGLAVDLARPDYGKAES